MTQHRAKYLFFKASLLALGLTHTVPAFSQTSPSPDAAKEPKLVIELRALTETVEDLRDQQSDTVGMNGGNMEAAILSAYAIKAAGTEIKNKAGIEGKILVAGYDDAVSADIYAVFQLEYAQLCKALGGCSSDSLKLQDLGLINKSAPSDFLGAFIPALGAFLPAIGAVLPALSSLFRSETEVSGLEGGLSDNRLLAYAVAKSYGENAVVFVPPTLTSIGADDATIKELQSLKDKRDLVAAGLLKTKPDVKKKAAVDAADLFFSALYTSDKDGNIILLDVIKARQIAEAMNGRKLLRVKIENSSGTLLKRKNLWVALGAPAIAASGGLIATYALDDGKGTSSKMGMVLCQAGVKNMRTIHKLDEKHDSRCKML